MTLRTLLAAFSAAALVICVNFLVVPQFWIRLYGGAADGQAVFLYRLIGAVFGGLAVMAWRARAVDPSAAREVMLRGLLVANTLLMLVAILGALTGVYNRLAWGPVGMFGAFAMGFARLPRERTETFPSA